MDGFGRSYIKGNPIDQNIDTDPIYRIKDFCEIFRISIFPPPNSCFIGIVNTSDVTALKTIATETFFEVRSLTHFSISQGH